VVPILNFLFSEGFQNTDVTIFSISKIQWELHLCPK
jgi:hypothetical protein